MAEEQGMGGMCNTPRTLWSMCLGLPRFHKWFLGVVRLLAWLLERVAPF